MLAALAHEPVDRVPVDFCGFQGTVIHRQAYRRLRAHLGLPPEEPVRASVQQGTVYAAEEILHRYGVDTRAAALLAGQLQVLEDEGELQPDGGHLLTGPDGSVWRKPAGGLYYDLWRPALVGELTSAAIAALPWPAIPSEELAALRARARRLHEQTDYAIVLAGFIIMPVSKTQMWRGFQQWSIDTLADTLRWQEMVEAYMERALAQADAILSAVGQYVDVAYIIGDDIAAQNGPWLRPSFYRRYIKPWHQRATDFVRARTEAKIIFHMCGAAREFIPDLIDIGVDALNPVQTSAAGMEPAGLKRDFGDHIAFWGSVDTQHILPFGTPDDVRREVWRCMQTLGPSGHVFASCQNIQADVPPENIVAMFEAVSTYYQSGEVL